MSSTLSELFEDFLSYLEQEKGYSRHTVTSYRRDLDVFHSYLHDRYSGSADLLQDVDKSCLRSFLGSEFENGLSSRTVARRLAAIKSLFRYLVKAEIVNENPALTIRTPKIPKKLPSFIQVDLIDKLMNMPDISTYLGVRDRAILELFYSTGMRLSELAGLTAGSIDLKRGTVKVRGKGNKERIIPFGEKAGKALEGYFRFQNKSITAIPSSTPVFTQKNGKRLSESSIQKRVRKYISMVAEGEQVGPHILRHSFATHMMDQGADIRAVKDLLGHSNLSSTQVYTHLQPERMKKIYRKAHPHGDE